VINFVLIAAKLTILPIYQNTFIPQDQKRIVDTFVNLYEI